MRVIRWGLTVLVLVGCASSPPPSPPAPEIVWECPADWSLCEWKVSTPLPNPVPEPTWWQEWWARVGKPPEVPPGSPPGSYWMQTCTYVHTLGTFCNWGLYTPVGPGPRGTFDDPRP